MCLESLRWGLLLKIKKYYLFKNDDIVPDMKQTAILHLAGGQGFAPRYTAPKTAVLLLDDPP